MLTHRNFWVGFAAAYILAVFLPPQRLFRGRPKSM
jgi:hypothetical protein